MSQSICECALAARVASTFPHEPLLKIIKLRLEYMDER